MGDRGANLCTLGEDLRDRMGGNRGEGRAGCTGMENHSHQYSLQPLHVHTQSGLHLLICMEEPVQIHLPRSLLKCSITLPWSR